MLHPLPTMIESQRHQVRRRNGRPAPRRHSTTEQNAIAAQSGNGSAAVATLIALVAALVVIAALTLV